MAKPFFRQNIPVGSQLTIKVSPVEGDTFVASAEIEDPSLKSHSFNDSQLQAGVTLLLNEVGAYVGKVDVVFAKEATARLQMEVLKTDGSKFVFDEPIIRPSNIDRTHVMLIVREEEP